ncbi:hypothetical protein BV22DRAFT_1001727 [Leucogyrophana mollusca]|uniref:Uncharacterized protein n=1 Tax=Leucogyrophana mollusca TaxID=85980 RepID=A0ACB8BXG3_9AGAM|nr:hypothetical protein BV22DRAFT_1001727 [Leucogyrophana mollusca]
MHLPFLSTKFQSIERRKGGGGGGKGGGGSGGKSGSSGGSKGGSSGGSSSGQKSSVPLSGSSGNGKSTATAYGSGGGKPITIPSGQYFSGRSAGGATRDEVYGSKQYGSGYPGVTGRGVAGRGFPFWFWPVIWGSTVGSSGAYLIDHEVIPFSLRIYGDSFNSSRLGGPMAEATFISGSTNTTFHLLSDNSTVSSLISSVDANCSSSLSSSSSTTPQPFNATAPGVPQPEQAIQYYRSSSVVLTLDGYNNSATLSSDDNAPDSPLPSGIDTTLLACLNSTIGQAAPLVDGAGMRWGTPSGPGLVGLVWVIWCISSLI